MPHYTTAVVACAAHPDAPTFANSNGFTVCSKCAACITNNIADAGHLLSRLGRDSDKPQVHWGSGDARLTTHRVAAKRRKTGDVSSDGDDADADDPGIDDVADGPDHTLDSDDAADADYGEDPEDADVGTTRPPPRPKTSPSKGLPAATRVAINKLRKQLANTTSDAARAVIKARITELMPTVPGAVPPAPDQPRDINKRRGLAAREDILRHLREGIERNTRELAALKEAQDRASDALSTAEADAKDNPEDKNTKAVLESAHLYYTNLLADVQKKAATLKQMTAAAKNEDTAIREIRARHAAEARAQAASIARHAPPTAAKPGLSSKRKRVGVGTGMLNISTRRKPKPAAAEATETKRDDTGAGAGAGADPTPAIVAEVPPRRKPLRDATLAFAIATCRAALKATTATAAAADAIMPVVTTHVGPTVVDAFFASRCPNVTQFATPERAYIPAVIAAAVITDTNLGNRNNFKLASAPLVDAARNAYTAFATAKTRQPWVEKVTAPPHGSVCVNNRVSKTLDGVMQAARDAIDGFLLTQTRGQTRSLAAHVRHIVMTSAAVAPPDARPAMEPMDITVAAPGDDAEGDDPATAFFRVPKFTPGMPGMENIVLTHRDLVIHSEWLPGVVDAVTKLYTTLGVPPAAVAAGAISHGVDRGAHLAYLIYFCVQLREASHGRVLANTETFVLMAAILWWAVHTPPGMPSPVTLQPSVSAAKVVKYCPSVGAAMQTLCNTAHLTTAKFRLSHHDHIDAAHARLNFPPGLMRNL